ncbi:MAG TPA: PH domain-containing protein [Actinomycetota bacterium]
MAFPRRLLIEGEDVVVELRPHWIALVVPIAVTILVVVGWGLAFGWAPDAGAGRTTVVFGAAIVAVLLLLAYVLPRIVAWATSIFVVTTDRIIHRKGLVAKYSMEIPLEAINDVRFQQGVFERLIGAGDLIIESAGERGRQVFADIRHPEEVQREIYAQGEQNKERMYQGGPPRGAPSTAGELERLADLRDRGVLTPEEFEAQKRRILGR